VNKFARIVVFCFVLSHLFVPAIALAQDSIGTAETITNQQLRSVKTAVPLLVAGTTETTTNQQPSKDEGSTGTTASFSISKTSFGYLGVGIGAGLAVIGGSIGIGLIGSRVIDASARQPEMLGQLRTLMFITAALVEGLALFALVICILCLFVG
jgi:F-type H+-transporting ATPase subunit c